MKDPYMFTVDVKPVSGIHKTFIFLLYEEVLNCEACIGVLGIQDICHFTSRDIGYYPFYF